MYMFKANEKGAVMGEKSCTQNCWEYLKCGREPGGIAAEREGVCPAAISQDLDSVNGGRNGGRICWAVSGTNCQESTRGKCNARFCILCPFFNKVKKEQEKAGEFHLLPP